MLLRIRLTNTKPLFYSASPIFGNRKIQSPVKKVKPIKMTKGRSETNRPMCRSYNLLTRVRIFQPVRGNTQPYLL